MLDITRLNTLPKQRVSGKEKEDPKYYANTLDYYIALGQSINDRNKTEEDIKLLSGIISQKDYERTLNPYNATNERFRRFPAILRNYDIIKGIIRRYVSEYIKNNHDYTVKANNPDIMMSRNLKLRQELMVIAENKISEIITNAYNEFLQTGEDPENFNIQEVIDVEKFIEEFNEKYVDDASAQGQELLNVIKDLTNDSLLYTQMIFEYVTFGEVYNYCEILGDTINKRVVKTIDAYPIPNDNIFIKDHDAFVELSKLTYNQILDEFGEYLTEKDINFLESNYGNNSSITSSYVSFSDYFKSYSDICSKFNDNELDNNKNNSFTLSRDNTGLLFDVWRVAYKGQCKVGIVNYINEIGILDTKTVDEYYKLNPSIGDISVEWIWQSQVYKGVRIGNRNIAIYPIKVKPITYNRKGELPYNGLSELLPGFGKFSIIDILKPYQILINILYYHREIAIAKNKINIVMIPKSLVGSTADNIDEALYRMAADGTFYADDEDDSSYQKLQHVRALNLDIGKYISEITNLIEDIKSNAREEVDMTAQRFGEIANSAGKSVTQEAIARGSMGSVIIEYLFDLMREQDYARDLDYSKFAWIDGLNTNYKDSDHNIKYISLDVDLHSYSDYIISAKLSVKEKEKLDEIKALAFSAGQNGDLKSAISSIMSDNVASIKKAIDKYEELKNEYELQLKQLDKETEESLKEFDIEKIRIKGEEDRLTEELKGVILKDLELIKADANLRSFSDDTTRVDITNAKNNLEAAKIEVDRERIRLERDKLNSNNNINDKNNKK